MATSVPPHNVAELLDAALYADLASGRGYWSAAAIRAGAGFPDRRHRDRHDRASIAETYRTGRGAFRLRSRWVKEDTGAAAGSRSSRKFRTACRRGG